VQSRGSGQAGRWRRPPALPGSLGEEAAGGEEADEGPDGSGGPAGEDVGGPVDSKVDAADSYECGEEDGGEKEEGFEAAEGVGSGEDDTQGQVGDGGEHGVAAGEAGGGDVDGGGNDVRAGAVDQILEQGAEERPADYGTGEKEGGGAVVVEGEIQASPEGEEGEDGEAAEGGDVAGGFLDKGGTERGEVGRVAEGEQDGAVEVTGFAVEDFVGQFGEEEGASGNDGECEEDAGFKAGCHHPLFLRGEGAATRDAWRCWCGGTGRTGKHCHRE
jgi:hypothetical protein